MADFSEQSANLSAPSGAGDQPVAAVHEQLPASGVPSAIESVGSLLANGVTAYAQQQLLQQKNAILGQVSQKEAALNQAVAQGSMSIQEAHARSMANYNQALAAYPQLASEINNVNSAFKATTGTGDRDTAIQDAQDAEKQRKTQLTQQAQAQGYIMPSNPSDAQFNAITDASQAHIAAQKQQEDFYKKQEYLRSQGTWNQAQQDREQKDTSMSIINNIAGSNFNAFSSEIDGLRDDVKSGNKTAEQAQLELNQRFGQISATLQSAAAKNPELAAPYRSLFENMNQLGTKMLDPKANSDELDREKKDLITRTQLLQLADPTVRSAVATSQMFNNNVMLQLPNAVAVQKALAISGQTPTSNGQSTQFTPPIVGDPNVEAPALQGLKSGIDQLRKGQVKDANAANIEGSNSVNQLLSQTGNYLNNGASPEKLKGLADFFASPQYGYMVKNGQIDPQAAQAAKKTFQIMYEPAMVDAIGKKLDVNLPDYSADQSGGNKATNMKNIVDVQFTGSGVVFTADKDLTPAQSQQAQGIISGLKSAQTGLNTLVHIGAHMEGTTDYQKYWEANKGYYLPQIYPDPAKLKPGDVKNGRKYIGGNYNNPSNWIAQDGGQ